MADDHRPDDGFNWGTYVPSSDLCGDVSPDGLVCSRERDHAGRHNSLHPLWAPWHG